MTSTNPHRLSLPNSVSASSISSSSVQSNVNESQANLDWIALKKNVPPATTVVVTLIDGVTVRGKFVSSGKHASGTDILSVTVGTITRQIPREIIREILVARGRGRNVLIGTAIGAGIMAILGRPRGDLNAYNTALFALLGAGAGAALGALVGPTWETVYQAP